MLENYKSLKHTTEQVVAIFPEDIKEFSDTVHMKGSVVNYMTWLGIQIQEVFRQNNIDIGSDDPYISEFRHIMKNAVMRVSNSGEKIGSTYFWIDVFKSNVKTLLD